MTMFGYHSESTSPFRRRIDEAARRYQARTERREVDAGVCEARRRQLTDLYAEVWRSVATRRKSSPMQVILEEVAAKHGLAPTAILSVRRQVSLVRARHEAFYRCVYETTNSYPTIGRFFGRDHTTVLYGARRHGQLLDAQAETTA